MTYRELAKRMVDQLEPLYGFNEAKAIQRYFFTGTGIKSMSEWLMIYDQEADSNFSQLAEEAVTDLLNYKPVQYIIGKASFMDMDFKVTPAVLIPRPETEELVKKVLSDCIKEKEYSILDIGTGSGIVAVSLAKELPRSSITAIDISEEALKVADFNAKQNRTDISLIKYDILKHLPENQVRNPLVSENKNRDPQLTKLMATAPFDIIVSNPPYIKLSEKSMMSDNVLNYEPHTALFVEDNNPLVFYRAIIHFANHHLKSNGCLYLEINELEDKNLESLLYASGYKYAEVYNDMNGKPRIIKAFGKADNVGS